MQLNQALFVLGGGSGYVPQPDIMRDDVFDPFDKDTLRVEPITIQLQVGASQGEQEHPGGISQTFLVLPSGARSSPPA